MTVLGPDIAPWVINMSLMQIRKQRLEDERRHAEVSQIDRFSLGPNEEGSKRGVTVLEGQGF